jgi:hypothetical protein
MMMVMETIMNYGKTWIQDINQNPAAMWETCVLATIPNIVLCTSVHDIFER